MVIYVWELLSVEKYSNSFSENSEEGRKENNSVKQKKEQQEELKNANEKELENDNEKTKIQRVDYDYTDELHITHKKLNEKIRMSFKKNQDQFYISDMSKNVKAYVRCQSSNMRSEIGITSEKKMHSDEEREWINNYIYNFISSCLFTYSECKHYIIVTKSKNLIQKLTKTGYGHYGIYFTNGKKVGGLGNLLISIKQVRHISYNFMRTLQYRTTSEASASNLDSLSFFN